MSELFDAVLTASEQINVGDNMSSYDDLDATINDAFEHSGIRGMKWYQRRFQNYDGTYTEEGKIRYRKSGGSKSIKKAEKERKHRQKIMSNRKKLYKNRGKFTEDELKKAMQVFETQDRLKSQIESQKAAARQAKEDRQRAKLEYKKLKLAQRLAEARADEQVKQDKLMTAQKELELKNKKDDKGKGSADKWQNRANKAKSILDLAKTGKDILVDLGLVEDEGSSLFANLGVLSGTKISKSQDPKETKAKRYKEQEAEWAHQSKYYDLLNKIKNYKTGGGKNKDKSVEDIWNDLDDDEKRIMASLINS